MHDMRQALLMQVRSFSSNNIRFTDLFFRRCRYRKSHLSQSRVHSNCVSIQTYSLLQTFFCCMAKYPELQKKAQEELDTIVGPDRMPTYDDYDSLFYVRAIFMECGRWLPVVPLSLPRRALEDDHYKGYFIPEGTVIFAVSVAIFEVQYEWTHQLTRYDTRVEHLVSSPRLDKSAALLIP